MRKGMTEREAGARPRGTGRRDDAEGLRNAIIENKPSPITYNSPKPPEIMEEDKLIQDYRIEVKPEGVTVMPVAKAFE